MFSNQSNQLLAVLCDGMGGHKAGDIASEMAVLQLGNEWKNTQFQSSKETIQWLENQINIENQRIYRIAKKYNDLEGMGTTLVTSAFIQDEIIIGNIGDSRAYQLSENELERITEDHSFANELKLRGEITEEEAKSHHKKNALTRSLGVFDKVEVDFFTLEREETELLLLCSDGLTNGLSDELIEEILTDEQSLEEKANVLIKEALKNGATDNITVCLVDPTIKKEMTVSGKEENK